MDSARIALAALATLGSGIVLGLAANPTMRTFPEVDWRARYRSSAPAADPAPQPGVSYYGDGSTAWVYGGIPARWRDTLQPIFADPWRDAAPYRPAPLPDVTVDPARDTFDAEASAAARAAAQEAVPDALARSTPRDEPAAQPAALDASRREPDAAQIGTANTEADADVTGSGDAEGMGG